MSDEKTPTLDRRNVLQALGFVGVAGVPAMGSATAEDENLRPTDENTVAYEELSERGKREFEKALRTKGFGNRGSAPDSFYVNPFVKYEGDVYETQFLIEYQHKNEINPTEIAAERIPADANVLEYEEMSERQQTMFGRALSECGYTTPGKSPEWAFSFDDQFTKKGGKHYRLNFKHADVVTYTLNPTKVE